MCDRAHLTMRQTLRIITYINKMWLPLFHMETIVKGLAHIAKKSTCSALAEV